MAPLEADEGEDSGDQWVAGAAVVLLVVAAEVSALAVALPVAAAPAVVGKGEEANGIIC